MNLPWRQRVLMMVLGLAACGRAAAAPGEDETIAAPGPSAPVSADGAQAFYQLPDEVPQDVPELLELPRFEADAPRAVDGLTLLRALQQVWAENPQVREAEKAIEAAGYEVSGSYGGFLPTVSVINGTGRNALSSVQASLPLWDGGLTLARIKGSKAREVIARANLDRVRLMLGGQTLTAFYNLAQAQTQLRQWADYLAALRRLEQTITNRAAEGVAPDADVQTAVSRIRQAEVGQEAARLQIVTSRNDLAQLIELSPQTVQWTDELADTLTALALADTADLVERNPEVLIAAAQVDEQTALARQAEAQLYPGLSLQYRHYYEGEAFDNTADEPQLVVRYEVGNSYSAYQGARAARSNAESAQANLETARRQALAALRGARDRLQSAARQRALQKAAAENTQSLVESVLRQYQVGRRSWVDVLNTQREAHDNQLGYIASRRTYGLSTQQLVLQMLAWDLLLLDAGSTAETPLPESTATP